MVIIYEITDKMREKYPEETREWEELQKKARDPKYMGCFTCRNYEGSLPKDLFVDVEMLEGKELPWDTEEAWAYCSLAKDSERSLRINCNNWVKSVE